MYIYYRQFSSIFRFITVVGLYLIGGFIYQRLVVGAKGWEQLPNYSFWQDFGNLQAVSLTVAQLMCCGLFQCKLFGWIFCGTTWVIIAGWL